MDDAKEQLGQAIDSVDNVMHSLNIPMPDSLQVMGMKATLPDIIKRLKDGFVAVTGENPWADE